MAAMLEAARMEVAPLLMVPTLRAWHFGMHCNIPAQPGLVEEVVAEVAATAVPADAVAVAMEAAAMVVESVAAAPEVAAMEVAAAAAGLAAIQAEPAVEVEGVAARSEWVATAAAVRGQRRG